MNIDNVKEGITLIQQGMGKLSHGPLDYYMRKLVDCYDLLIDRFAPHKVGDRVILTKAPEIKPDSGWSCCKHFLVKGALATVREVSCDSGGFSFELMFDDETWIDDEGNKNPVTDKHVFHFGEDFVVAARV